MKSGEIKVDETYTFMGSESPARSHLAGQPFTVVEIKNVWRRVKKGRRKVKRFFNSDGIGARADELEPLPEREFACQECDLGEYKQVGSTSPAGTVTYACDKCGHNVSFP